MGQRHHIAERAIEIGKDPALSNGLHIGTERTASLTVPGIEIDPLLIESGSDHIRLFLIEPGKLFY